MVLLNTALKLLKKNKGQNLFFFLSSFATSTMVFVLCNMLNNTTFSQLTLEDMTFIDQSRYYMRNPVLDLSTFSFIMFIALVYSLVLNYYTSQVFTNNYRKSITTLLLIGFSSPQASTVLLLQYSILMFPAMILGFISSRFIILPAIDSFIYNSFGITGVEPGIIYYGTYAIYFSLVASIITMFVLVQKGQIESRTITDLLHKRVRTNLNFKNKIIERIVARNYPLFYLLGMGMFVFNTNAKILPCLLIGCYACFGLMFFTIPADCKIIKSKKPTVETYLVLSEYVTNLRESFLSCLMLMISVLVSVVLVCQENVSEISCIMSVFALASVIIMVCVSLFSQLFMGVEEREENAYREMCMGIDKNRIMAISTKELVLFYMTLILVPCVFCTAIIIPSVLYGTLMLKYGIIFMLLVIIPLLITMVLTIIVFNNRIRRRIWKS